MLLQVINYFSMLQCPLKECVPADRTLHILSHFIMKTEDELREIITKYMLSRLNWFQSVSRLCLQADKISVEHYIDYIHTPGTPLDLLGIFVLARLYRFHVGLILNKGMWCSNLKKDMQGCTTIFVFQGETDFHETYKGGQEAYVESLQYNTHKGLMPSHCTEVKNVTNDDDVVFVAEEKRVDPKIGMDVKVKIKREFNLDVMAGFKPKNKAKQAQFGAAQKLLAKSKQELAVKEERDTQRQIISAAIARIITHSKSAASSSKMISMDCPVCGQYSRSKRSLLKHIKDDHPGTKFPCKYCAKQYDSFNGCYKHERSAHQQKSYFCPICGHGFDYKSQLDCHLPVHNPTQKTYCDNCGKGFATERSMKRHYVLHMDLQFACGQCTKVFNTPEKRQCHFKGTHGSGYQSLCGDFVFKWPGRHARHQGKCTSCQKIKDQKLLQRFPARSS